MLIRDLMTQPVHVVPVGASLEEAAQAMLSHRIGALPVVAGDGRLAGILTTSDFAAREAGIPFSVFEAPKVLGRWLGKEGLEAIYATARTRPVEEVMTRTPVVVGGEATVEEAVRAMLGAGVHHVLVVQNDRPIGIVSRRDLLRLLLPR